MIVGIILTLIGFTIFQWSAIKQSKSAIDRPLIFDNFIAVLIINIFWIGLIAAGFYDLWKVNPIIVFVLISIYAILWIFGYFIRKGNEK